MFAKTNPLKSADSHCAAILAERRKIQAALDKAIAAQPAAEAKFQSAMEDLSAGEADSALAEPSEQVSTRQQRKAVADAREAMDAIAAGVAGLRNRLAALPIVDTAEEFRRAKDEAFDLELASYSAEFTRAAEQFANLIRRGQAMAAAFGGVLPGLDQVRISAPGSGEFLVDLAPNGGQAAWQRDPKAIAVFQSFVASMENGVQIDRIAKAIEYVHAEQKAADDHRKVAEHQARAHFIDYSGQTALAPDPGPPMQGPHGTATAMRPSTQDA